MINLTNLVTNGSFEANTSGWSGFMTNNQGIQSSLAPTRQNILAPRHNETGDYSAQMGVRTQGLVYINPTTPIPVTTGHKYYIRARVNLRGTVSGVFVSGCTVVNTTTVPTRGFVLPSPMSDGLQTTITDRWVLIDTIWTANQPTLNLRFIWQTTANQGNNDIYGQVDNVVVVDLTDDFGQGSEPPLMAIREGVNNPSSPNGWWDGTMGVEMPLPPVILTNALPIAIKGRAYNTQIEIEPGTGTQPFLFSLSGLPVGHGLFIDTSGRITGSPNLPSGTYPVTVTVTDRIGYQITRAYDLEVGEPPVIRNDFIPGAVYGFSYSFTPTVDGSMPLDVSVTVTSGTLPTGLSISGQTILGTPTISGQMCQVTITATNQYDSVTKTFSFGVYSEPFINTVSPLPNGIRGNPYSITFDASGIPQVSFELLSGNLPLGLSMDQNGNLTGTPLATGAYQFSVRAYNDLGSYTKLFTLSVYEIPVITTTIFGYARLGIPYSGQLTATGTQPIQYSIISGSLPVGLSLDQNTGTISGEALTSGSFTFTVIASNDAGNSEPKTFTIDSGMAIAITTTSPLPTGTVNVPYNSLQLEAAGLDSSQVPLQTWTWQPQSGSSIPSGLVLNSTTGLISGTPTLAGVYNVLITLTNGPNTTTSPFTIEIGAPPIITTNTTIIGGIDRPFTIVLQATGTRPITWQMVSGPNPPANINLDSNGALSWLVPDVGTYQFTVVATNVFGNSVPTIFNLTITSPSIIDVFLDDGIVGVPYNHTFTAGGLPPFTWMVIGFLPPGLSFDTNTGTISGTPLTPGTFDFQIRATNAGGYAQEPFSITVNARPVILTGALNSGYEGLSYSQTIQASGTTPITFSLASGSLPPGLSLAGATISGVPDSGTVGNTYTFTTHAENVLGPGFADEREFSITILPQGAPIITSESLLYGTRGVPFSVTFAATGDPPISWSIPGSPLPNGLSFGADTVSGIPTVSGIFPFTVFATNVNGSDQRVFTLTIADPPIITTPSLDDGKVNVVYYQTISADGASPKSWMVVAPSGDETGLPPGLSLNTTMGVIAGTPTLAGIYKFTIQVTNTFGQDTRQFQITISRQSGTFIQGKEIGHLFIQGKQVNQAFVNGTLIYKL